MTHYIGVDLGGSNLRAGLVDKSGQILEKKRISTPVEEGPEATAQKIATFCRELKTFSESVLAVGVGSPGPLSRKERKIFQTPNLPGFDDFPLGARVEELCGIPTFLDNDATCAGIGEQRFGAAQGCQDFILLTFGTGIGGALMANGKMIYGKSDGASELGHITLYPEGLLCKCGNRGCFEQYASATAIGQRASKAKGSESSVPELFASFEKREDWALNCVHEITIDLSIALATLVNIFDPEKIILGGGVFSKGGGPFCQLLREEIKGRCFASSLRGLQIEASGLAGDAGILGAAAMAINLTSS